jgi:hypothetical protein
VKLAGMAGNSRDRVRCLCWSVFGVSISIGATQKIIGRTAQAFDSYFKEEHVDLDRITRLAQQPLPCDQIAFLLQ